MSHLENNKFQDLIIKYSKYELIQDLVIKYSKYELIQDCLILIIIVSL